AASPTSFLDIFQSSSGLSQIKAATALEIVYTNQEALDINSTIAGAIYLNKPVGGLTRSSSTIALTNANVTLSAAQLAGSRIVLTGTLTGNVQIDFGNVTAEYVINVAGLSLGGNTLTIKNGTATKAYSVLPTGGLILLDASANAIAT